MTRDEAAETLYSHIMDAGFNAPYGVLINQGKSHSGKPCVKISFGRARTLDATLSVFSPRFIHLKTSQRQNEIFKTLEDTIDALKRL